MLWIAHVLGQDHYSLFGLSFSCVLHVDGHSRMTYPSLHANPAIRP
jgi:hypothetical protein